MILRVKNQNIAIVHCRVCCFSGGFNQETRELRPGDTIEAMWVDMESPKRRKERWQPYDAARAARNPQLEIVAYTDSGTLHPDRIYIRHVGDVEITEE